MTSTIVYVPNPVPVVNPPTPNQVMTQWMMSGAIIGYLLVHAITPAFRRLFSKEDAETARVNNFIAFQQSQLKELIGAIDRQTSTVEEQSKTVGRLSVAVEHLIRSLSQKPR